MSLANTLSVLLNFKTDMSGLTKFTDGIRTSLAQVQELNKSLSNGAAAVNSALQVAAGYFAVGALKGYTDEAIQARTAQAKLDQALKQTKQSSAAYRSELGAQASALQQVTGMEDEVISGVQRQLVFAGAQKKNIAELTALTLDFAAAKEIDAVSAAKAVGRALQGQGDELARYGVEVNLAGDKTAALLAGLGKFKGQAATAFAALPEGMRAFKVASKEAQQSAGEAVLEISSPFLQGLANGLKAITDRFTKMREEGSLVQDTLHGVATWLGNVVGGNLDKLLMLAGALLVLKGGGYAVNEVVKMMASSFLLVTGQSLPAMLAGLQTLSKDVGILQALSVGGWAARLAVALTGIAVGMAAFAVGSAVIGSIEQAQLSRLGREDQVRGKLAEQTHEFSKQLGAIRSITEARATAAAIEEQLRAAVEERDKLEKKQQASKAMMVGASPDQMIAAASAGLSSDEQTRLQDLEKQIFDLAQRFRLATDRAFIDRTVNKNVNATSKARAALTPDEQAKAEDLDNKRAALELETSITEAQIEGNFELENRLTRERDELQLMQALKAANPDATAYNSGADAIRAKLDVEEELRRKAHDKVLLERELFDLESRATKAESEGNTKLAEQLREQAKLKQLAAQFDNREPELVKARVDAERLLTQEKNKRAENERLIGEKIGALELKRADIESNRLLTVVDKQSLVNVLLAEENKLTADLIALRKGEIDAGASDEEKLRLQQEIATLRKQIADNTRTIGTNQPLAMGDAVTSGTNSFFDQLGSKAESLARGVQSIWQGVTAGISGSISGLMNKTMTWGGALRNIGASFLSSMVGAFAQIGAEWAVMTLKNVAMYLLSKTQMFAIDTLFAAKGLALSLAGAAKSLVAWIPSAIAASISSWGMAAAIGAAAVLALVAFSTGGLVSGPGSSTSDSIPARLSDGEFVQRTAAVEKFGVPFMEGLNAGVLDLQALPASMMKTDYGTGAGASATQTSAASASGGAASAGGAMDLHAALRDFAGRITIVQVASDREAQSIARRGRAVGDIIHIVRNNQAAITRRGPAD